MIPSTYLFSSTRPITPDLHVSEAALEGEELWTQSEHDRRGSWHFWYPTLSDFVGQCIKRPHPTSCVKVGDAIVVLERGEDVDRVVTAAYNGEDASRVLTSIAAHAQQNGRRFFAFSMGEQLSVDLDTKPGFLAVLPVHSSERDRDIVAPWRIDSGDRM